jgi:PBP1b-binding outer membrane lipoprotein LpoB
MRLMILLLAILLVGCEQSPPTQEEFGKVVSSRVVPTSWNEPIRTEITTTEGVFSVVSTGPVRNGSRVVIMRQGRDVWYWVGGLGDCRAFR